MIKISDDLKKSFKENDKRLRTWPTWKLKVNNLNYDGGIETVWGRMSKHDQEFNLIYNKIMGLCHEATLPNLKRILAMLEEQ